jgi:hypothetical protein
LLRETDADIDVRLFLAPRAQARREREQQAHGSIGWSHSETGDLRTSPDLEKSLETPTATTFSQRWEPGA